MDLHLADPCEILDWDTAFFGVRIARVVCDQLTPDLATQINQWCTERKVQCLYFLARSDDAVTCRLAEDHRFRLVDVRITLKAAAETPAAGGDKPPVPGVLTRRARLSDVPFLEKIARQSHRDSRFYFDPNFPRSLCEELYATWLRKSLEGYADVVFVAHQSDQPIGYVTCKINPDSVGQIGLIAIEESFRGLGVAKLILEEAFRWFAENGISETIVFTQARNTGAQRFYQRGGFLTWSVHLWYHKWFELLRPLF